VPRGSRRPGAAFASGTGFSLDERNAAEKAVLKRRLAALAAFAVVGVFSAPSDVAASANQITILDPTPSLLNGETAARRADTLDRLQALGVDTVRVQVQWRFLAPAPESSIKPQGFDASDPGDYPGHAFDVLDSIVRGIEARGMDPLLTPTSPIPDWASPAGRGGIYKPDPDEFEQFVEALGRRYDGTCVPPKCASPQPNGLPLLPGPPSAQPLPRVDQWAIWNEPNLRIFLRPQRLPDGRTISGQIYRRLFLVAQRGLAAAGHARDLLLIGETAPSRGSASTPPLKFLRQVLCISRRYRLLHDCQPIEADGWAHHPYNPHIPPWEPPERTHRQIISIGSINRLVKVLQRAARAGATAERLPVYVTEYGVESYPQEGFGVSPQRQAEYLGIAEYLLYRNPWVRSFAQYLLDDDPNPSQELSFQTGLRFANGYPKPSYDAFPVTLVVRRRGAGVELWGHIRPAGAPAQVQLRYRAGDQGAGRLFDIAEAGKDGYFRLFSAYRPGRQWQASSVLPNGTVLRGPFVRSYRFR
jgi:hypothetical protein